MIVNDQTDYSVFAIRLKQERNKRNLTQIELGRLCNFGPNQINRYESGNREPSVNAVIQLAKVLEISLDYLLGLSDKLHGQLIATDLDPRDRQLLEAFHKDGWSGVFKLGAERIAK